MGDSVPGTIRVRISSEAAGSITMTPVVSQVMPLRELLQVILSTTGKDPSRVMEVLARGAVVQGASRFRWAPLKPESHEIAAWLAQFPDPDPARKLHRGRCTGARLRAGRQIIEIPAAIAAQKRLFGRRTFWDTLMDLAEQSEPRYLDYSYRTRSDEYRLTLTAQQVALVHQNAGLLKHTGLAARIRAAAIQDIEFVVRYPE